MYGHPNESYGEILSCGAVYYYKMVLTFESRYEIIKCNDSK